MKPPTIELNNPKNQHIVWLDVVRLIAMFTVVCCHCTDHSTSIRAQLQYWGNKIVGSHLRCCTSSVCASVCNDYRRIALACPG